MYGFVHATVMVYWVIMGKLIDHVCYTDTLRQGRFCSATYIRRLREVGRPKRGIENTGMKTEIMETEVSHKYHIENTSIKNRGT